MGAKQERERAMASDTYEYPDPPGWEPPGQSGFPNAPTPEPPRTGSKRLTKWLVGIAVAVVVFAGAVAGITVMNHTRQTASPTPKTPKDTALQQWWVGAEQDFTDLQHASDEVAQASSHFKPGALAAACQDVHDAAEVKMQSHLPSPNPELTAELHAAVEDFHSAAHLCLAVAAGSLANYDGEFMASMAQANKHMRSAQDIINKMLADV